MKMFILFSIILTCNIFGESDGSLSKILSRHKRDATGALDIHTNYAQPIHADVKNDNAAVEKAINNSQLCPKTYVGNFPSDIESGTGFQVTPPKDIILYQGKSLRKSLPPTTTLDLIRAVSRVVTLLALLFSAVVEFYPLVTHLYYTVYDFINPNKF